MLQLTKWLFAVILMCRIITDNSLISVVLEFQKITKSKEYEFYHNYI